MSQGKVNDVYIRHIFMHKLIMNPFESEFVDHKDMCKNNNRKSNLRLCNKSQNESNKPKRNYAKKSSSKYKGVCFEVSKQRWRARIKLNNKYIHIGYFTSQGERTAW